MKYNLLGVSGLIVAIASASVAQAVVVSVDFQSNIDTFFEDMSGVEPNAAAADADFGAANVWNIAGLNSHYATPGSNDVNPTWSNLVNSMGVATTATFSITGNVIGTEVVGLGENALNSDGLFFDGAGAFASLTTSSLEWQISGLIAGAPYKLYLNQLDVSTWLGSPQNRAMKGFIDTTGSGTPDQAYQMDFPGVFVTGTVAADGIIRGTSIRAAEGSTAGSTEPDWAGWQLSMAEIPLAPEVLTLEINTSSGEITLLNTNDVESFDISYYEILSGEASLNESGWNQLAGRSGEFPAGDGSGNGWEASGTPSASFLGEVFLDGSSEIVAGATLSLGNAYNTNVDQRTVTFNYLVGDSIVQGNVIYVSSIDGDFNGDGNVDGADFVIWQTNFPNNTGNATLASGDANGDGNVDGADFVIWQTNFPFSSGAGAVQTPEPTSIVALALGMAIATSLHWRRRRTKSSRPDTRLN